MQSNSASCLFFSMVLALFTWPFLAPGLFREIQTVFVYLMTVWSIVILCLVIGSLTGSKDRGES